MEFDRLFVIFVFFDYENMFINCFSLALIYGLYFRDNLR